MNDLKCWNLPESEYLKINHDIWKMKFQSEGLVYPHCSQKLILGSMLYDFSCYGLDEDSSYKIIHPVFNHENHSVTYQYQELANVCGWRTSKPLKKYLKFLSETGFIIIPHSTNKQFEVKINLRKIIEAPKFADEVNDQ